MTSIEFYELGLVVKLANVNYQKFLADNKEKLANRSKVNAPIREQRDRLREIWLVALADLNHAAHRLEG